MGMGECDGLGEAVAPGFVDPVVLVAPVPPDVDVAVDVELFVEPPPGVPVPDVPVVEELGFGFEASGRFAGEEPHAPSRTAASAAAPIGFIQA